MAAYTDPRGYDEAPAPLTDRERALMKRMFSDFFEVPGEWKTALKAELEKDPPVLGKYTLGGQAPALKENSVQSVHIADGAIVMDDLNASLRALLTRQMVTGWGSDNLPTVTGNGPVIRVPYDNGAAITLTLKRAFARVETPGASSTVFKIERSTAAGVFTPTLIETLTIAASAYSTEDTSPTAWTVSSGDELRIVFDTLGTTGPYQVQLQWEA